MTTRISDALGFEGARVSLTICGDARIRVLNRLHRGIDRATDVLAFPQEYMREGRFVRPSPAAGAWLTTHDHRRGTGYGARGTRRRAGLSNRRMRPEACSLKPEALRLELGDVVISRDAVRRQAAAYGVSEAEEWTRLLVHGILHLLGWDHEKPAERTRMRTLEDRLVGIFNRTSSPP